MDDSVKQDIIRELGIDLLPPEEQEEAFAKIGAIILQGPHHSAQKSTNTGVLDFKTSEGKFCSVK